MKKQDLPKTIPVFPLSNFIIFPHTTVPLNIFEPRYIEMIKDSMKTNKLIGLIQPKQNKLNTIPDLHEIGCLGIITNFKDATDGRYAIELKGVTRFKIIKEIKNNKAYRTCEITFENSIIIIGEFFLIIFKALFITSNSLPSTSILISISLFKNSLENL